MRTMSDAEEIVRRVVHRDVSVVKCLCNGRQCDGDGKLEGRDLLI